MNFLKLKQNIDLKGFFIVFVALVCLLTPVHAQPQNIPQTPEQILKAFQDGLLSLTNAGKALSDIKELEGVNLPINDAKDLIQNLKNVATDAGGKLLEGIGVDIPLDKINDIVGMVENINAGNIDPQIINDLLEKVGGGQLPPELGEALSAIRDLKALTEIKDLQDLIQNPKVLEALKNINLPADVTKALGEITNLVSNINALPETIAAELVRELQRIAPELVAALGGPAALTAALTGAIGGAGGSPPPGEAGASCGASCPTCQDCAPKINLNHQRIRAHVTSEFEQHRNWLVSSFFLDNIAPAMALMTTQLTATGMQQVQIIGTFFDAKHQLETQRLFQTLTAQAHKDYHPSEGLCEIGTSVRSLAASERRNDLSHRVLATRMMDRQNLSLDGISSDGRDQDRISRRDLFIKKFCDKTDHAGGLEKLCKESGSSPNQINMDIDYTNTIGGKLTLDLDFTDDAVTPSSEDEENIFALSANLFANEVLPALADDLMVDRDGEPTDNVNYLLDLRAIAAKRSVAQNSFAAITALKTEGDGEAAPFLKAILAESGIAPEEIEARLGENPSYYAQMEVMTKDMYQNPTFYANLYDKPANIERKSAALLSLEIMQDRDIYKSLLRSEAVLATLIEVMIQKDHDNVSSELDNVNTLSTPMKE